MKVLHILFEEIHFDARVQKEIDSLTNAGYECHLLYLASVKPTFANVKSFPVFAPTFKSIFRPLSWIIKFMKLYIKTNYVIKKYNYEILHLHNIFPAITVLLLKNKSPKIIYDTHEMFSEIKRDNIIINLILKYFDEKTLKNADIVIHANKYRMQYLQKKYNLENINTYIHNFASKDYINKNNIINIDLVDELKAKGMKILIYQGALSKGRNIEKIVSAFKNIDENFALILVGGGNLFTYLENYIKANELSSKVFLVGKVPFKEVFSYTRMADAGLVIYENNSLNNYYCAPNKIFEYAFSGIPVIGIDFPPIKEIIEKENIGITFSENDIISFNKILNNFFDPNFYKNYKNNLKGIENKYNWEKEAERLINLYNKLDSISNY